MSHLVLHEPRVPAGLEQVRGVGASERVKVEALREAQFLAVAADSSDQGGFDDETVAFAREEVECAGFTATIGEPVFEDAGRPVPDRR